MKRALKDFTTVELEAELARRKQGAVKHGLDWHYFAYNDFDDGIYFGIVHKDFWNQHHHLDDHHISNSVTMPPGFSEEMESVFQFDGTAEDGERLLQEYGFTKVTN